MCWCKRFCEVNDVSSGISPKCICAVHLQFNTINLIPSLFFGMLLLAPTHLCSNPPFSSFSLLLQVWSRDFVLIVNGRECQVFKYHYGSAVLYIHRADLLIDVVLDVQEFLYQKSSCVRLLQILAISLIRFFKIVFTHLFYLYGSYLDNVHAWKLQTNLKNGLSSGNSVQDSLSHMFAACVEIVIPKCHGRKPSLHVNGTYFLNFWLLFLLSILRNQLLGKPWWEWIC